MHGRPVPPFLDVTSCLNVSTQPDIYIIGTQECEQSIEKALISLDVSKEKWQGLLSSALGEQYELRSSQVLASMHTAVFVNKDVSGMVTDVSTSYVVAGAGNMIANKGATGLTFNIGRNSFLVINSHLPASHDGVKARNAAYHHISTDMTFDTQKVSSSHSQLDPDQSHSSKRPNNLPRNPKKAWVVESTPVRFDEDALDAEYNARQQSRPITAGSVITEDHQRPRTSDLRPKTAVVHDVDDDDDDILNELELDWAVSSSSDIRHDDGGDEGPLKYPTFLDYDFVIWLGDLNYRINGNRDVVERLVDDGALDVLISNDQLMMQRKEGLAFKNWAEGVITFPPTYKYDEGSSIYDTSKKRRVPAWCDRILYRDNGRMNREIRESAYDLECALHPRVYTVPVTGGTYVTSSGGTFPSKTPYSYCAQPRNWRMRAVGYYAIQQMLFSDHKPVVCDLECNVNVGHSKRHADNRQRNDVVHGCCVLM